eukprot:jgi/Mesvir1/26899/Mv20627-RA.1
MAGSAVAWPGGPFKPVTHVIFDMDGLLLNTEDLYTVAAQRIASEYGQTFPFATKIRMMGLPALAACQLCIRETGLPLTPEEYLRKREAIQDELWPTAELMPGAGRLLEHLFRKGVPAALATSSYGAPYRAKVSRHMALFDRFASVTCGDDPELKKGKPAPDIFLLAASRLGASPENCLVFEDAPSGVQSALAAGMQVVWVPHSFMLEEGSSGDAPGVLGDLSASGIVAASGATQTVASLMHFQPHLFGLPPFEDGAE